MNSNFRRHLNLNIGKNNLIFDVDWKTSSSDLTVAENVVNGLLDEKDLLLQTIRTLQNEIIESNNLKTVAMDMVRY